jgi:predicted nucleotidyltransferase
MAILENLVQFGSERKLEFMVIGGHAVISHGYSRRTLDLDILIPKGDGHVWKEYVLGLGYSLLFESENFFQCTAPELASWPLDFMMVKPETFSKFKSEAVPVLIQGVQVSVPSIKHLIALKLHAMKSGQRSRMFRDMDDVINLIQLSKMEVKGDEFKKLCQTYGSTELYEYLLRARA